MGWMWDTYTDISDAVGHLFEPGSNAPSMYRESSALTYFEMQSAVQHGMEDAAWAYNRPIYWTGGSKPEKLPPRYVRQGPATPDALTIQFKSLGKPIKHGIKRVWREKTHWRLTHLGYKTWTDRRGRKWVDYDVINTKEYKVYDCDGKEVR